jgi:uncharacterized protein
VEFKDSRFRLTSLQLKQDEDGNEFAEFEGYGSVFSNEDLGADVVEPGAFAKTLQENSEIPMLWQHWRDEPIGKYFDVHEDAKGLRLKGQINLAVKKGREAYALLKQGALKGLSIGYDILKHVKEFDDENDREITRLQELKLWEVSLVTFPMNQQARVEVIKARNRNLELSEVLTEVKELRAMIAAREPLSPEEALSVKHFLDIREWVQTAIKEGRVLSGTNRSKLAAVLEAMEGARGPIKELLDATEPVKSTPGEEKEDEPDYHSLLEEFRSEVKHLMEREVSPA